jgi:TetR/AcrR family fatty acid metabolism transcriptional regulator
VRRRGGSLSSPRRAEAKAGTRQRIVQSALEIFAREGYHATSMDAIAAAAAVSKGALYHHFPGKLDLFSALVDEFSGGLAAAVTAAIAGQRGGLARVEAALRAAIETFGRHRALARIVLVEAPGLSPAYAERRRQVLGRFAALVRHYLDQAAAEGSIPPLDTEVAAWAWVGAVNELVTQWLYGELADLASAVPALSGLLLRSIGAPPARA